MTTPRHIALSLLIAACLATAPSARAFTGGSTDTSNSAAPNGDWVDKAEGKLGGICDAMNSAGGKAGGATFGAPKGGDNRYLSEKLYGNHYQVLGTLPNAGPMPTKSMSRFSPITLMPHLYEERDDGAGLYRGEDAQDVAGASRTYRELRNPWSAAGGCISMSGEEGDEPLGAEDARLTLNYCANQYILAYHNDPHEIFDENGQTSDFFDPDVCQDFALKPLSQKDKDNNLFEVSYYLKRAIVKTGVEGIVTNNPENIQLDDLAVKHTTKSGERTFERIFDPSHPFSPRQDYVYTDRFRFFPLMAQYGFGMTNLNSKATSPTNALACAKVPVHVMRWRQKEFEECMGPRVVVNLACHYLNIFCRIPLEIKGLYPPCSTRYDEKDNLDACETAMGKVDEDCCAPLRAPVVAINTLKIRTNNKFNFPYGVAEGLSFKEYFGDKLFSGQVPMPYMRWWDTGKSAGGKEEGKQDPENTLGGLDAIVGAGREGENCVMGGDGVAAGGTPDPNTSWAELKMYQMNTFTRSHAMCLGKYEKVFKPLGAEEFVLAKAGGLFRMAVPGKGESTQAWPLGWRGYVSEPFQSKRFPNLNGAEKGNISGGLNMAQAGDIVYWDDQYATKRLPHAAFVTEIGKDDAGNQWVRVVEQNYGKYPDACGNTNALGLKSERMMYKPGSNIPGLEGVTCDDPDLKACIENTWDQVKIWRPTEGAK